ncbi:HAD-IIA family hydrolase [Nocardioides litoris]|uniref:HAD-IIA family hydrolase n=1 Tax=Nocardioides litoris TaxID=1926648 RepID=UPI001FEC884F|nr:HAD hydrolase-like protein [Nocardioides litoris]
MLLTCADPLGRAYDLAMLDLDGVVYVGPDAVPGAAEHLAAAREAGLRVAFITNNASRPPSRVAAHLTDLDVPAEVADVVTSAQAAASVLADRLGAGARVVLLGGEGLEVALAERDLVAVRVDADADALVTGYGPQVLWGDIMRGAVRIRDGLWWVASNTDASIPTPYGVAPGHGVLVDTLRRFTGVEPVVAGKPARPLLDETVRRVGGERPLMVGDRLDTDIEGGRAAGFDTLLVLTGVTGLPELVSAAEAERPSYIGLDLRALREPHLAPEESDGAWTCEGWTARSTEGRLSVEGRGPEAAWWRAAAAAGWAWLDAEGEPVDVDGVTPPVPGSGGGAG